MDFPEKKFRYHESFISLERKIMNLFQDVWIDYLMSLLRKYKNIPQFKNLLSYLFQKLKELEEDELIFSFVLEKENSCKEDIPNIKEIIPEQHDYDLDPDNKKDSEQIALLEKHKESFEMIDYLFVKALLSESVSETIVLLNLILSIQPSNSLAYLLYNFLKANENNQIVNFFEALANYPSENYLNDAAIAGFFGFIKSLYQVINADNWLIPSDFITLLRPFGSNRVCLYRFLRTLNDKFSSENILELLPHAIKQNPQENELEELRIVMLYKSKRYEEAYDMMRQIDIFELFLTTDQFIEFEFIYSDLLRRDNQIGKALLELESIVENEDYQGILSDDFFNACFLLIRIYNKIGYYSDAAAIYHDILELHQDYLVKYDAYTYFALKADMYLGLDDIEMATYYQELALKQS